MNDFQEMVEELRLVPYDLAKKYGIPVRTVYAWFSGSRKPAPYLIKMIRRLEQNGKDIGCINKQ